MYSAAYRQSVSQGIQWTVELVIQWTAELEIQWSDELGVSQAGQSVHLKKDSRCIQLYNTPGPGESL